ncbi:MAG: MFS transporter [Candidatus Pacebacteria bacterium]|nr:MFS transporter [Candidatus Paceibacterota bacterium]
MKLYLNRALRILLVTNALILVSGAMLGPIYALFVERIGGDLLDASFAFATFSLSAGLTAVLSGKFTDKVKEKELIIIFGYVLMALGFFSYIFVQNTWQLLLVQVVIGLGEAIYSPAFDAVYSQHINESKFGLQWSFWEAMNYFVMAVGALVGGYLTNFFGFNLMFFLMSVLCLMSAVYLYILPRKIL